MGGNSLEKQYVELKKLQKEIIDKFVIIVREYGQGIPLLQELNMALSAFINEGLPRAGISKDGWRELINYARGKLRPDE